MTSHKINFTLPDMPNSINFQISFTVNSEESEPMLDVKHSTVNTQEVINLQDNSSNLSVKPLKTEDPISIDEFFKNVSLSDKTKKDYKGLVIANDSENFCVGANIGIYSLYSATKGVDVVIESANDDDFHNNEVMEYNRRKNFIENTSLSERIKTQSDLLKLNKNIERFN